MYQFASLGKWTASYELVLICCFDCCVREEFKKFWRKIIAYFSLLRNGPHRKTMRQTIIFCCGNVFTGPLPSNNRAIHRPTDSTLTRHGPHRKRCVQQFFHCCRRNVFTGPLPSNDRRIHIQTYRQQSDLISLLLFIQNEESGLRKECNGKQISSSFIS
jgi:hypothetical protein